MKHMINDNNVCNMLRSYKTKKNYFDIGPWCVLRLFSSDLLILFFLFAAITEGIEFQFFF